MSWAFRNGESISMKNLMQHVIVEVPRRQARVEWLIEAASRPHRRPPERWFTDLPPARVAMEAGTHSIWISEQLQELGHEVIVANVRELRAISHSDRKSDQVNAEKLARYARLGPESLRPIAHRTVEQQEALTLIRARDLMVRLPTGQ
jgi:transposase